jgi:hypothetical protein
MSLWLNAEKVNEKKDKVEYQAVPTMDSLNTDTQTDTSGNHWLLPNEERVPSDTLKSPALGEGHEPSDTISTAIISRDPNDTDPKVGPLSAPDISKTDNETLSKSDSMNVISE